MRKTMKTNKPSKKLVKQLAKEYPKGVVLSAQKVKAPAKKKTKK